jgi:hypothetical protein
LDNGTLEFYKNGTSQGTAYSNLTGKTLVPVIGYYNSTSTSSVNFGQMPFIYTPPTGFSALQTNNLPEPTIKNGKEHFKAITWSGDGTQGRNIAGLEFQPDLVWIKRRNGANQHNLYDSIRGVTKHLTPDNVYGESTTANSLTAFNSDGFQVGTGASDNTSSPASTYVAWCWKAGGTAVSNGNGSITSSVSANTDAGFSIVSYTGTGSNATVGHGLNSAPEFVITKERNNTRNWGVYHKGSGNNNILFLNLANAKSAAAEYWQNTDPTASVFSIGTSTYVNNSSGNYIAYCWASIPGYSAFGSYSGNGNADGPFIYTGMRSAFVMIKRTDSNGNWYVWDTTRDPNNDCFHHLIPDANNSENTNSGHSNQIDIVSNGFKLRRNGGNTNANNANYIYCCFAENPFGGENAPPATAR